MTLAKNIGAWERWARLIGGGFLILLELSLVGWARWVSGFAGFALVLTAAFRY